VRYELKDLRIHIYIYIYIYTCHVDGFTDAHMDRQSVKFLSCGYLLCNDDAKAS